MTTNLSEVRQKNSNYHSEEKKQEPPQSSLRRIETQIRSYLEKNREEMRQEFIQLHESILKRCKWSILGNECLSPEVENSLQCFASQRLENIEELIDWIDLTSHQPLLEFFNTKFNNPKKCLLNQLKRIEKFLTRTTPLLQQSTIRYSDSEIREYVKILVNYSQYYEQEPSEKIRPLMDYLNRTGHSQFSLVIQTVLEIEGTLAANFIKTLISDEILLSQLRSITFNKSDRGCSEAHIERAIEILLRNSSHTYTPHFVDVIFGLLIDKKAHSFIEKVFNKAFSEELLYHRVRLLLQKVISEKDGRQSQRIHHFMQLILKNQRLLNLFHQTPLPSDEKARLVSLILNTYKWNDLPESIEKRMNIKVFNPLFYYLEQFIHIADGDIQEKILHIFLNLIEHDGQDLIGESRKSKDSFKGISQLIKILLARFNCKEIFKGQSQGFLDHIFTRLMQITAIRGESHKKLEMIEKILNACLEVKLEHIGRLAQKGNLGILYDKISEAFDGLETFEILERRANLFERSFSHLLFAQLYSDDDFKGWFRDENPKIDREKTEHVLKAMQAKRESIHKAYHEVLTQNGFEYIHNNQIGALATVDSCIDQENVFLKLGTGQGKSLIAEMSAIHLLSSPRPPKRVFIFTSYDHLAKRDYQDMKFLSTASGFPSTYISSSTSFRGQIDEIRGAKILHIDSENFHSFLSKSFGEALDTNQDFSELINIFFNQKECAVILDEGDLMIMDDPGHGRVHRFQNTFASTPINMSTEKERFDQTVGLELIQALNENFSGCYNAWYASATQHMRGETSATHEASGKKSTFVGSFSHRVNLGSYQLSPLLFNFSAFVRSFRDVLFLSGSIHERNFEVFQDYFTNGKKNFYANIPLFFGSHNWSNNLIERKKLGNLDESSWRTQIEDDIEEAIKEGQPILLFASSTDDLEMLQKRLRENTKISAANWITITDESSLEAQSKRIGERNTITFATTICGRGIDIRISKDIEWGLHVLITKLPDNNNERLLIQMIGRTARLDRKGSVSILVKEDITQFERIAENNMKRPIVDDKLQRRERQLELSKLFLSQLRSSCDSRAVKRWIFFLEIISSGHVDLLQPEIYERAKKFVTEGL